MSKRLAAAAAFSAIFTVPSPSDAVKLASTLHDLPAPSATVQVVEFYNAALDHFFVTADPVELAFLDAGSLKGWARTGYRFGAFSSGSQNAALSAVCRFYGLPKAGLDSHFYSGSNAECEAAVAKFAASWQLESNQVFQVRMPDPVTGACPASTIPVYRLFNNRRDANHRYTTDANVRLKMIARGAIAEGYGKDGVAFCADTGTTPATPTDPAATPISVSILATEVAPDMFSFSSSVAATVGLGVMAYAWNFGDGTTDLGPTVSHRFAAAGDYTVALTVADDKGNTGSTSTRVTARTPAVPPTTPPGSTTPPPPTNPPPATASDFDSRKTAPGVVRWFDFDSASQLGQSVYGAKVGYFAGDKAMPVIDTSVKASGGGALRIDTPPFSGSNAGGYWYANFSDDLSVRFGANSEFYVQWRQRFNKAMVETAFKGTDGSITAWKLADIVTGDTPTKRWDSCEAIELVLVNYYAKGFPVMYNSCTGSSTHGPYAGFYEPWSPSPTQATSDFKLQNMFPPDGCRYSANNVSPPTTAAPGCFTFAPDEWMTFKVWVKLGPRNDATRDFDNSEVKLWGARQGQPSQLLMHWRPGIRGYFPLAAGTAAEDQKYGKLILMPYMTNKDKTLDHPLAQTWYDEVIISRQDIADPAPAGAATSPPNAGANGKLALAANTAVNLGPYSPALPVGDDLGNSPHTTDYSGMQYDANRRQMVLFGGGHAGSNSDAINRFSLDALTWSPAYQPTPRANWVIGNYDFASGAWLGGPSGPYPRPAARHSLDLNVMVGNELVVLAKVDGNYPNLQGDWSASPAFVNGADHYVNTRGRAAHYNFSSGTWSFATTAGYGGDASNYPSAAYDPVSGKVIVIGDQMMEVYDPVAKTRTTVINFLSTGGSGALRDETGNVVPNTLGINQNLVYFPPTGKFYYFVRTGEVFEITLDRGDFSKSKLTRLTTTGAPYSGPETGVAYDSKNQLIGVGPLANVFYTFNPVTKAWASKTIAGGAPGSVLFHCIDYDPVNNVYIFIGTGNLTWAYRYQ